MCIRHIHQYHNAISDTLIVVVGAIFVSVIPLFIIDYHGTDSDVVSTETSVIGYHQYCLGGKISLLNVC